MGRKRKVAFGVLASCLMILLVATSSCSLVGQTGEQPPGASERVEFQSYVAVDVYRPVGGEMVLIYHQESHNVITNVGLHTIVRYLTNQTTAWQWTAALQGTGGSLNKYYSVTYPAWIALSTDSTSVDATHSSWQAVDSSYLSDIEITTGGLSRANAAVAPGVFTQVVTYIPGSGINMGSLKYSIARTFTATSSFTGIQKAGLFTSAWNANLGTSGSAISPLVAENTFTPVNLSVGDQIAVTWSITLGTPPPP